MSDTTQEKVTDHEYDGIREYDNPTPGWWVMVFVATVIFSAIYFLYYHVSPDSTNLKDAWEVAYSEDLKKQFAGIGELKTDAPSLAAYMQKADYLSVGKSVFKSNCISCHGPDGAGLVGVNLTDEYYKNIQTLDDLPRVIENGAANGAMPAWKNRLQPQEVALVAAYVASLRGQNLPGRPPEGAKIAPWPAAPAASASAPAPKAP